MHRIALLAVAMMWTGTAAWAAVPPDDNSAAVARLGLTLSPRPLRDMPGWQPPKKIVVFVDKTPGRLEWLQQVAPGVTLVAVHNHDEGLAAIADADGQIGGNCSRDMIAAGSRLRWIHNFVAGIDTCFGGTALPRVKSGAITITRTERVLTDVVADHGVALILALARGIDLFARMNERGHFAPVSTDRLWEVQGRTLLVAGLGAIGTEVARQAHAIGMHVIATKAKDRSHPDFVDYAGLADELPALAAKADIVISTLPLTPETTGLFNADLFARMKKGAIFVNIGRGKEVVTADLIAALKSGQIGAAGLDVTDPEPLPDNDPLFSAPNILITPHKGSTASGTADNVGGETSWDLARENLRRFVNGDSLYSVADPQRGY